METTGLIELPWLDAAAATSEVERAVPSESPEPAAENRSDAEELWRRLRDMIEETVERQVHAALGRLDLHGMVAAALTRWTEQRRALWR